MKVLQTASPRLAFVAAFWLLWVAVSAAGCALGASAFHAQASLPLKPLLGPLSLFLAIALPATFQALVLRIWLTQTGRWIWAGTLGFLLGLFPLGWALGVADTQGSSAFASIAVPTGFALSGAVGGAVEWLVLRRWVRHAGWWIPFRMIGSLASIQAFAYFTRGADDHFFLGGAVSGACSAGITGVLLGMLLRNYRRSEPPPVAELGAAPKKQTT